MKKKHNERLTKVKSDENKTQNSSHNRRQVLKNTLAGSAFLTAGVAGGKWIKPSVESVLLPAHAATTGGDGEPGGGEDPILGPFFGSVAILINASLPNSAAEQGIVSHAIDSLIPEANAGVSDADRALLCITMTSQTTYNAKLAYYYNLHMGDNWVVQEDGIDKLQIGNGYALFETNGTVGNMESLTPNCPNFKAYPLNVSPPTAGSVQVTMFMQSTNLPAIACNLPMTSCPTLYNPCLELDDEEKGPDVVVC